MNLVTYYVENLTLRALLLELGPRLLRSRLHWGSKVARCHVIEGSRFSLFWAKALAYVAKVDVQKMEFRISDIRDEEGLSIRLQISHRYLARLRDAVAAEIGLDEMIENGTLPDRLPAYLAKKIAATDPTDREGLWRVMNLVQVCLWKSKTQEESASTPFIFLERRPWSTAIRRYISEQGLDSISIGAPINPRAKIRKLLPLRLVEFLQFFRHRPAGTSLFSAFSRWTESRAQSRAAEPITQSKGKPLVGVQYYGQFNLNQPERHSDLFFYQRSSLPAENVLLSFTVDRDPVDLLKWKELSEHGIKAIAVHPGATIIPQVPVFIHRKRPLPVHFDRKGSDGAWLNDQIGKYRELRTYWEDLAETFNIKVFTTWFKYDASHCAISDALRATGGVASVYQRAYEFHPSAETTIDTDIKFAFSAAGADVERLSQSKIRYHVATGYLGDHRFAILNDSAQRVRDTLLRNGAKRICAFFDENSSPDERWHTGHQVTREDYTFLLEKVLTNPWFGLVIKPKSVADIRERLGPVAQILKEAEATGRCILFQDRHPNSYHGWDPPAAAALAADVAVHGYISAATAGVEAALGGVPTLMMDRDGWDVSPIYRLGAGNVVFTEWEQMWEACQQQWSGHGKVPGFGDWSSMLDELDPFRDGLAAERMGTYLQWLVEGFQHGLDREAVMANAAERYCSAWGADKITEVKGGWPSVQEPTPEGASRVLSNAIGQ